MSIDPPRGLPPMRTPVANNDFWGLISDSIFFSASRFSVGDARSTATTSPEA
eukprot:CAMPEP_0206608294 /NCGR_PEP_ID=MMETSP0325_2-20121206/52896_1 /ASSEMBLY_ACC=CAM_ASM_000347 /TAXON_ID=2866 /ORGANISM="Crypthecodinium cohnii, Strain Seligo" /LENGTH=51 /DNA_ID=CAMNT_0054125943 /DNA_START=41 /DNA_END=196 /DNA_ORIENTATION=+